MRGKQAGSPAGPYGGAPERRGMALQRAQACRAVQGRRPGYFSIFGGAPTAGISASWVGFSVIEKFTVNFAASLSVE